MTIGGIKKTTREKVVRALRTCSSDKGDCEEYPYNETSEEPIGCLNLLVSDAADLIENQAREIEALAQANAAKRDELEKRRWIPVAEALPKAFVSVLGHVPEEAPLPTVHECYYAGDQWYVHGLLGTREVTHWMPMPEFEEGRA